MNFLHSLDMYKLVEFSLHKYLFFVEELVRRPVHFVFLYSYCIDLAFHLYNRASHVIALSNLSFTQSCVYLLFHNLLDTRLSFYILWTNLSLILLLFVLFWYIKWLDCTVVQTYKDCLYQPLFFDKRCHLTQVRTWLTKNISLSDVSFQIKF